MPDNSNDAIDLSLKGMIQGIGDVIDGGQDLFDTITDFVSGNDDDDFRSEIETVVDRGITLTDTEKDTLLDWTKPLMNNFQRATFPRHGRKHAKAGELMRPVGFKCVMDTKKESGIRINFFAQEPFSSDFSNGYKKGFEAGQKSRTSLKKIRV